MQRCLEHYPDPEVYIYVCLASSSSTTGKRSKDGFFSSGFLCWILSLSKCLSNFCFDNTGLVEGEVREEQTPSEAAYAGCCPPVVELPRRRVHRTQMLRQGRRLRRLGAAQRLQGSCRGAAGACSRLQEGARWVQGGAGGAHSGLAWSRLQAKWTAPILLQPVPAARSTCCLAFPQSENSLMQSVWT